MEELPFRAEYAKSGRASCKGCKSNIGQGSLRIARMVQSAMFDGKVPFWYHMKCFFGKKQRPKSVDDIAYFESLRWEDQEKIKEQITDVATAVVPLPKKGKKRDKKEAAAIKAALADFKIEYSKSSRATCRGCEQKIMKGEVRISKKDYETEVGMKYGGQDMWHHLTCFAKLRSELQYFEGADKLPGFKTLNKEDQTVAKKEIPPIKQEDEPDAKKVKKEEDTVDNSNEKEMKEQNKILYKFRDNLSALSKQELIDILDENDQEVPAGLDVILDRVSDLMTFGALLPCEKCKGQLIFHKYGYICTGDLTEWAKCTNFVKIPKRKKCVIPNNLKKEYSFLKKYKYKKMDRAVKEGLPASSTIVKKDEKEGDHLPKVSREKPPLYNMEFVLLGNLSKNKDDLKKSITLLGGKVVTKISKTVMAVISTPEEVAKESSRINQAQDADIQVVSEDFLEEAKSNTGKIPELVLKKSICNWGSDPSKRLPQDELLTKSKSGSMYTKSVPSKVKLQLKGGTTVDPDSNLEDQAHVYVHGKDKYTVILGKTDIQSGKNSFYKLQLLEADNKNKYWVFRSWGRIGTIIGSSKVEPMSSLHEAKNHFCNLYEEKTGNDWETRDDFEKVPGKMYPIDVDYGDDEVLQKTSNVPSSLPKPVEDLMHLIFDLGNMKKVMLEFELDMEKMPLGKLSKKQLQKAYSVLTELQSFVSNGSNKDNRDKIIDACNRFYTLVPHNFGVDNPPLIDDLEDIKKKIEMLEALMEMEIAYNLMKESNEKGGNPADAQYAQLKADIHVLDRESVEFKVIEEYVKKTHAPTHTNYELEIHEVFAVVRYGEEERYKKYKSLHNRKLLWHGSRTTNYGGILCQGLRIAPPEAPSTGYMFGKGIYFADMVSKSANYCCASSTNSAGLLLLCEVALGEMYERTTAKYIEKLPKGKHSCKGVGKTYPDPSEHTKLHEDVEVPVGKPITRNDFSSSLLYNEYIVYDPAQVYTRYLVRTNFKFKY
ncbi:poly [ADP-ribose] polymerase [Agrilus planipennis]|uniref:Poly [ADP-ribose] polymerase n=1 Tax=Agrilus planipennis TaxID=224129 RepID=A0A1W4XRS2_AGRPL|nr:poly [ADP-ribose] polymerase [Agrilus planipennis]